VVHLHVNSITPLHLKQQLSIAQYPCFVNIIHVFRINWLFDSFHDSLRVRLLSYSNGAGPSVAFGPLLVSTYKQLITI
jgi:hypothetical protein